MFLSSAFIVNQLNDIVKTSRYINILENVLLNCSLQVTINTLNLCNQTLSLSEYDLARLSVVYNLFCHLSAGIQTVQSPFVH